MFENVGIKNALIFINADFKSRWGKPESDRFIIDKLNEIIERRHRVAHTANALAITRLELEEAVKFLEIIADLLEIKLQERIRSIINSLPTAPSPVAPH